MPTAKQCREILAQQGAQAAVELLRTGESGPAREVVQWWLAHPQAGPVLDAILSFPDYRVRRTLLVEKRVEVSSLRDDAAGLAALIYRYRNGGSPPEETSVFVEPRLKIRRNMFRALSEDELSIWREHILPQLFLHDPSFEIRAWAADVLSFFFPDLLPGLTACPEQRRAVFSHPRWSLSVIDVISTYLRHAPSIGEDEVELLKEGLRAGTRAGKNVLWWRILSPLAEREDVAPCDEFCPDSPLIYQVGDIQLGERGRSKSNLLPYADRRADREISGASPS